MAKKKKKSGQNGKSPVPQKGISTTTFIIYAAIFVAVIVVCVLLGTAMDLSVQPDGELDFTKITENFPVVMQSPSVIFVALKAADSYAKKMPIFGGIAIGVYFLYKYSESGKRLHRRGVEHGSAKWGSKSEMKSLADPAKPEFKPLLTSDGKRVFDEKGDFAGVYIDKNIILSEEVRLALNTYGHGLNLNCLVEGGSGTGKTRSIVEPNIMQLNTSYVITDPKGEILQHTGKLLTEAGYEVRVLNLIEMNHSNNYNPFNYVYDKDGYLSEDAIQKMITALFAATKGDGEKEDFWSQKGKTMLNAIILLLFEESAYQAEIDEKGRVVESTRDRTHLNFYAVAEKMRSLQYPPRGSQLPDGYFLERNPDEDEAAFRARQEAAFLCPLDKDFIELQKRKPKGCLALDLYKEVRNAPEETGQSFLSSANVKTFMFNLDGIKNLTCCDNIELEKLGDRKTALFLIISSMDGTYNFLANIMYTQMFDTLSIQASFKHGGTLPIHVRCIMDEFANIGEIPEFDKVIAIVRSWGVSVTIILQSLSQLKARYEKTYETILDCCATTIFLGGKGQTTLKELSATLGKETIDVQGHNKTKGRQSSTSENNSIMGRELMTEGELAAMPRDQCIVMCQYHNPFLNHKFVLENHPNYKYLSHYDKKNAFDINSIHSITVAEYEKICHGETESATSSTNAEPVRLEKDESNDKIDIYFQRSDAEVMFETYGDVALYADDDLFSEISEEYTDQTPKYGELSEFESLDFGEPTGEPREEVYEDAEDDESSAAVEQQDTCHYSVPDEDVQPLDIEELNEVEAVLDCKETYADEPYEEDAIGDELVDEEELDMDYDDDGFGLF